MESDFTLNNLRSRTRKGIQTRKERPEKEFIALVKKRIIETADMGDNSVQVNHDQFTYYEARDIIWKKINEELTVVENKNCAVTVSW